MVERARGAAGVEIVIGSVRPKRPGAFYEPTVIAGPDQRSEIVQDEVFGPLVMVRRFTDEEQAIVWANDVRFGLAASVWTCGRGLHGRQARDARVPAEVVRSRTPPAGTCSNPASSDLGVRFRMKPAQNLSSCTAFDLGRLPDRRDGECHARAASASRSAPRERIVSRSHGERKTRIGCRMPTAA